MPHASATRSSRPPSTGKVGGEGGSARGERVDAAVVVTETVMFVALLPGVAGFGEIVQVASEGAPVQVKLIAWFKPPRPSSASV